MTMFRYLLIPAFMLLALICSAQSVDQWIGWGDAAMEREEFYGASKFYAEALRSEPGRLAVQWKQAEACRLSNQYDLAAGLYDRVYRKDQGRTYPDALRWLAEMQMCQSLYDEAEASWRKLIQRERRKNAFNLARAENGLFGCALARSDPADTTGIVVEHLPQPVNSFESEFAPNISADGTLFFSSLRGEFTIEEEVKDTADYRTRIYRSDHSNSNWSLPVAITTTINGEGENANITWSTDGRKTYFTRCIPGRPCRIHFRLEGSDTTAIALPGLGEEMSTQPMIVKWEDREMLLFVSDRAGGIGGTDIWQAEIVDDSARSVVPINGKVNTIGNERTPWFDPVENKLYFSSDFLPGHGGYDIFISEWKDDEFGDPMNAGKPLNSPANDLYPSIDPQREHFWFASNRIGSLAVKGATCCSDIYRYPMEKQPVVRIDDPAVTDTLTSYRAAIENIRSKFPVVLYFHNDDPDPRSWAQRTDQTYEEAYQRYRSLLPEYAKHEDRERLDRFFHEHVDAGRELLDELIHAIVPALENGEQVILSVRGHASPLAKNDYNRYLSQRRISSLENHIRTVRDAELSPYIDGTASNGGRLRIEELPFGEERSANTVSDDLRDLKNSVYSVEAMRERRIEIEAIQLSSAKPSSEEMHLVQRVGKLREDQERIFTFTLRNTGQKPLRLIGSKADCGCTTADLPSDPIQPDGSAEVKIHFNGRAPVGPLSRSVSVLTDGEPAEFRLTIEGEIIDRDK